MLEITEHSVRPPTRRSLSGRKDVRRGTHAYCSSIKCCQVVTHVSARGPRYHKAYDMVVKFVAPGVIDCPDCSSVLLWVKK